LFRVMAVAICFLAFFYYRLPSYNILAFVLSPKAKVLHGN
jgi:hypothetical protein